MNFKKREITERVDSFSLSDIEGELDSFIAKLLAYKSELKYHKFSIDTDREYCFGSDDPNYSIVINGVRLETDKEFESRKSLELKGLEREKARLEAVEKNKEKKDREDYERLKAKFENKIK